MPLNIFSRKYKSKDNNHPDFITIVSGLPRSGTSMMMKMLEAGGMEILTDNLRISDESNPKGYYEFERVKKLKDGDTGWVEDAAGKVVKVISALLEHLPAGHDYKVIFMRRDMDEILSSQRRMLKRRGEPIDEQSDNRMGDLFHQHLSKTEYWLGQQPNMQVLFVSYNEILANPRQHLERVLKFIGLPLDMARMEATVDKTLYRERRG